MENLNAIKESISKISPNYIELCSDFLILYSRFEYALKECGFLRSGGRVMASIDGYANSITERFKPEAQTPLSNAVNYILKSPPKVQESINSNIVWSDNTKEGNAIEVLPEYIRRVRNNLLHGGKFYGGIDIGSRNWHLIVNSMIIIEHWIELDNNVKRRFLEL